MTNTSMISMSTSTSHSSGMLDGSLHGQGVLGVVGEFVVAVGEETGLGVALAWQVPNSL